MRLATGVDLIEVTRVEAVVARHSQRFLRRIFTPAELSLCAGRTESLAAHFAAKEAVAKALGCGIGPVTWLEIEILGDEQNAPRLQLHGAAQGLAGRLGLETWSLSLSHTREHAVAVAVALGDRSLDLA
jgi:holo-[acyl-carrier protein] synthase